MLEFLKGLLKKEEEQPPQVLTFDELAGWLEEIDTRSRKELETATDAARTHLEALRKSLLAQVKDLKVPEEKRHLHPKLEKVALSTLPLFERSMSQTLAKPFPAGTDEFYAAAGDCLKTSLKTLQGQGRYLQAIFPEEMKGIRGTLKDFGHEINALTEATKNFRDHDAKVQEIRKIYDAIREIAENQDGSGGRKAQIVQRIDDARKNIAGLIGERTKLKQTPEYHAFLKMQEQIQEIEKNLEREMREFTVLSAAIAHVFRKAEKVAGRKGDGTSAKAIRIATTLLSDHEVPKPEDLSSALKGAFPIVLPLIESGEVPLKNKEERALFSDTAHVSEILEKCAIAYHSLAEKISVAKEELSGNLILAQMNRFETELRQMEKLVERGENQIADFAKHMDDAVGALPTLATELDLTVSQYSDGKIRVQVDSCNSIIKNVEKSV